MYDKCTLLSLNNAPDCCCCWFFFYESQNVSVIVLLIDKKLFLTAVGISG